MLNLAMMKLKVLCQLLGKRSQPLAERETYHPKERHSQGTENESNNIFIAEKPGEMDREDEEEHELAEDVKQEEPVPPGQMQSHPGSQAEGQIAPYSEEEEMDIIYSEEEIASFKNIFDMFDKESTGYINLNDFQSIINSLNRNKEEVLKLLDEFGFGKENGLLSFQEFIVLMQALEKRIIVDEEQPENQEQEGEGDNMGEFQVRICGSCEPKVSHCRGASPIWIPTSSNRNPLLI
ncbi:unnamed protein product [Moneuplotes crassus]|uniref:EF-hand domain-containing protein n=1 Tax=Euplotes crassus TaxID=5936 RepID=A0AAD1U168_EUPCR|nr:unnamed protein product [Moneuplotes crassus]